jgi:hypothetical protein
MAWSSTCGPSGLFARKVIGHLPDSKANRLSLAEFAAAADDRNLRSPLGADSRRLSREYASRFTTAVLN